MALVSAQPQHRVRRHSTTLAAGSAGLSFPFPQLGSLRPFLLGGGRRKPSQHGARQEARPALPTAYCLARGQLLPQVHVAPALQMVG